MTILGRFYEKIEKTMIEVSSKKSIIFFSIKLTVNTHRLESEFYADSNGEVYFLRIPFFFSNERFSAKKGKKRQC